MQIPESILEPFGYTGMPFLQLGIEGGVGISREELIKIKQVIYAFMKTFEHLDLMLGDGKNFVCHALGQAALENGADWAKCNIKKTLSGENRAFLEYGKVGGRWQLFSVVIPRPKSRV